MIQSVRARHPDLQTWQLFVKVWTFKQIKLTTFFWTCQKIADIGCGEVIFITMEYCTNPFLTRQFLWQWEVLKLYINLSITYNNYLNTHCYHLHCVRYGQRVILLSYYRMQTLLLLVFSFPIFFIMEDWRAVFLLI